MDGSSRGGTTQEGSVKGGRPSLLHVQDLFAAAEEEIQTQQDGSRRGGTALPAAIAPSPSGSPGPSQHGALQLPASLIERLSRQSTCMRTALAGHQLRSWSGEKLDELARLGLGAPLAPPPRPVLDYSGRVSSNLRRRCAEAAAMLERLSQPAAGSSGKGVGGVEALPRAALRFCKGLAFVAQHKAGCLAGGSWGHGLLIRRLPDGAFSAPLFLRLRSASLGLTLGYQTIEACHVLQSEQQVQAFAANHRSVTLDATRSRGNARAKSNRCTASHSAVACDGALWDLSLQAGFTRPDHRLNCLLYGDGVTADEVLGGRVALPAEFLPLYRAIDALAAEAQTTRHTVSKFELARQQSAALARHPSPAPPGGPAALLRRVKSVLARSSGSVGTPQAREGSWRGSADTASLGRGSGSAGGGGGSLLHASPTEAGQPGGSFKLFGEVALDFKELFTYEQQEVEEQ